MKSTVIFLILTAFFIAPASCLLADTSSSTYEQESAKLSTEISASLKNTGVKTVSITGFTDLNGGKTDLGTLLTEDLTIDLVNQNKDISIIDRSHHDQDDDEQRSDADKVDAVISGTIIPLGSLYRIEIKVMALDSGKLLAAKRFSVTRTDELDALMGISETDDLSSQNPNTSPFPNHAPIPKDALKLWLKADAGVRADSHHRIKQWTDLSGSGNNACQSAPEHRPILVPGDLHGKSVIKFDGSTYLSTNSVVTTGQDYSVFVVSTLGGINGPFYNGNSGESGWGFNRTRNLQAYGLSNGGIEYGIFGSLQNQGDYQLLSATRGSGTTSFYAFGTLIGTNSIALSNPIGASYVGTINPANNGAFTGNIAEIIVYDRKVSDAERQSIERYLATKYDLKLSSSSKSTSPQDLGAEDE